MMKRHFARAVSTYSRAQETNMRRDDNTYVRLSHCNFSSTNKLVPCSNLKNLTHQVTLNRTENNLTAKCGGVLGNFSNKHAFEDIRSKCGF